MSNQIEQIRERIEARKSNTNAAGDYDEYADGIVVGLASALRIIDEVEKEQKPAQPAPAATIKGWVARDGNGDAYLYPYYRPTRDKRMWFGMTGIFLKCDPFPDLKWEDEPKPVRVIIEEIKD